MMGSAITWEYQCSILAARQKMKIIIHDVKQMRVGGMGGTPRRHPNVILSRGRKY